MSFPLDLVKSKATLIGASHERLPNGSNKCPELVLPWMVDTSKSSFFRSMAIQRLETPSSSKIPNILCKARHPPFSVSTTGAGAFFSLPCFVSLCPMFLPTLATGAWPKVVRLSGGSNQCGEFNGEYILQDPFARRCAGNRPCGQAKSTFPEIVACS